ncbi:DMT family transporter [Candidatus Roizmanbacteria bacterium]|nr:DMT family transporter [Candidatus Roizmanbacteria bacterium]
MNKQSDFAKGILFALITSVISGFAIFYSKISVAKIDPLILATSRNLYVGIIFFLLVLFSTKLSIIKDLRRKDIFQLILIGLIGGGIPFYLFFTGLKLIGPQTGNIIHKTLFLWVTVLSVIFLKERVKPLYILSYMMVIVGTFFFLPFKLGFGKGELFVLSATFLWAVENIIAKKVLKNVSANLVGLFRMGIGSMILLGLTFFTGKQNLLLSSNVNQLTTIIIGATILSFYVFFWYRALKYAPAGLVTLLLTFSVVVGTVLNGGFAGVRLTQKDILSTLFIGVGALIIYLKILSQHFLHFIKRHG